MEINKMQYLLVGLILLIFFEQAKSEDSFLSDMSEKELLEIRSFDTKKINPVEYYKKKTLDPIWSKTPEDQKDLLQLGDFKLVDQNLKELNKDYLQKSMIILNFGNILRNFIYLDKHKTMVNF